MSELFWKLLNRGLTVSWLVLAVVVLRVLLKKAPKSIHCLLWALVGLRLVWPFSIQSEASLLPASQVLTQAAPSGPVEVTTGIAVVNAYSSAYLTHQAAAKPGLMEALMARAGWIWLAGLILMALWAAFSWLRLRRRVAESVPEGEGVYLSEHISSPFVLGLFPPKIYLPAGLSEADRFHVTAHERSHIRRRDHWWKPLGYLLLSVYWFNPLLWLGYALLCRDIEEATDQAVIRALGEEHKAAYSRSLLSCASRGSAVAVCPLAFGEVGVGQRVKGVLSYKKPAFWMMLVSAAVCCAAAVMFLTDPAEPLPQSVDPATLTGTEDCVTICAPLSSAWPKVYTDPGVIAAVSGMMDGLTGEDTAENLDVQSWLSVELRLEGQTRTLLVDRLGVGFLFVGEEDAPQQKFDPGSLDFDYLWRLYTGASQSDAAHTPVYTAGALLSQHLALSFLPADGSDYAYVQELGEMLTIRDRAGTLTFSGELAEEKAYTREEIFRLFDENIIASYHPEPHPLEKLIPPAVTAVATRIYRADQEEFSIWELTLESGESWLWLGQGGELPHRLFELIDRDQFHPGTEVFFWTHSPATSVLLITFTGDFTEVTVSADTGSLSDTPPMIQSSGFYDPKGEVTVAPGATVWWIPGSAPDRAALTYTMALPGGGSYTDEFSLERLSRCESVYGNVTYGVSQDWLGSLSSRLHRTRLSPADRGLEVQLLGDGLWMGAAMDTTGQSITGTGLPLQTFDAPLE